MRISVPALTNDKIAIIVIAILVIVSMPSIGQHNAEVPVESEWDVEGEFREFRADMGIYDGTGGRMPYNRTYEFFNPPDGGGGVWFMFGTEGGTFFIQLFSAGDDVKIVGTYISRFNKSVIPLGDMTIHDRYAKFNIIISRLNILDINVKLYAGNQTKCLADEVIRDYISFNVGCEYHILGVVGIREVEQ